MRLLGNAEGRLERREDVSDDGHAPIKMRGADRPEHAALVADAKSAIERLDGVDWAEVDAVIGRLIVVFDPAAIDADDLIESLETVEELHDVADERIPARPARPLRRSHADPPQRVRYCRRRLRTRLCDCFAGAALHAPTR